MELVTVPLELLEEAATDISKEMVNSVEQSEFGKVRDELRAESISLGKLCDDENGSQLNFGTANEADFFNGDEKMKSVSCYVDNEDIGCTAKNDEPLAGDVVLEPQVSFRGGLSACNYKCITSYCYPVNIAKGIGTANPHQPNSKIGHT